MKICGRAFVGCPVDAEEFEEELQAVWRELPVPGQRPELVHWRKHYDYMATPGADPDQFKIARTSDPDTNPVFILFAHTIGTPVRPPVAGWGGLRDYLDSHGWSFIALVGDADFLDPNNPPANKIPLSGTMFELFDAMSAAHDTDLRNRPI